MNFLAHAYLSFEQPEILSGNMMGDFVKGKQKNNFPEGIRKGIELHWFIDSFTDTHPVVIEAKHVFQPIVRLYSGMFVDVAFDYFLATDALEKTADEWKIFSGQSYQKIEQYRAYFPENFTTLFYYMKKYDWLYNYRFLSEIQNSFKSVAQRAHYMKIDETLVFTAFENNISFLKDCYDRFFPELKEAARKKISTESLLL